MNIQTKFPKIPRDNPPRDWPRFFHAGTHWLYAYDIIKREQATNPTSWLPYVYPYMLSLTVALFVKSIVAHEDNSFNPKNYYHNTTRIINDYANRIPILETISRTLS